VAAATDDATVSTKLGTDVGRLDAVRGQTKLTILVKGSATAADACSSLEELVH